MTKATPVLRHRLSTRLWHWTNLIAVAVLLMSGLMIFNAHAHLYWGEYGANFDKPWLEIVARGGRGWLVIGDWRVDTTGWLGVWTDHRGTVQRHAFPGWATLPTDYNLAAARTWHLAFAWVLSLGLAAYLVVSLVNRHIVRDLHITAREWHPAHIWRDIVDHARLRFPKGEAALRYNVLQKLAYGAVLFVLLPLVILTGLAMSPGTDAWSSVSAWLGGRQTARSIHFLCAVGLVLFFAVHIVMVLLAGPVSHVRAMITGRYRLPPGDGA